MIEIVSGTDRPGSNSRKIADILKSLYKAEGADAEIIDLNELAFEDAIGGRYLEGATGSIKAAVDRVEKAEGLVMVVPEYNGSFPGALKLFIDYWRYPVSFEARAVAYVGVGYRWGGLRPVEHLQQVFGYRNAFNFPSRVFVSNVGKVLVDGKIVDPMVHELLQIQTRDFIQFIKALRHVKLHAHDKPQASK